MPTVVVNDPEIGLSTSTPFDFMPVIVIREPANRLPVSGALMATPIALQPVANRLDPDPSQISPVKAADPSNRTPMLPAPPPLTLIKLAAWPSLISEPVKPPSTC